MSEPGGHVARVEVLALVVRLQAHQRSMLEYLDALGDEVAQHEQLVFRRAWLGLRLGLANLRMDRRVRQLPVRAAKELVGDAADLAPVARRVVVGREPLGHDLRRQLDEREPLEPGHLRVELGVRVGRLRLRTLVADVHIAVGLTLPALIVTHIALGRRARTPARPACSSPVDISAAFHSVTFSEGRGSP